MDISNEQSFKVFAPLRANIVFPNQNNSGFSHMLPFLKAFFMQSNLAETKQKLSTFLGKEIDFIAGLGINFSVGKVLLG